MAFQVLGDTVIDQNQIITSPKLILEGTSASESILSGSLNGDSKLEIKADGSTSFAGGLFNLAANGGLTMGSPGTDNGVVLSMIAGTNPAPSAYTLFQGIQSDGTTQAFAFKVDGTATFAGNIQATDGTQYAKVYETGFVQANRTNGNNYVFEGRLSGATTSSINGDGFAWFNSNIQTGGDPNNASADGIKLFSAGACYASRSSGNDDLFVGYQTGNTTPAIRLKANGSANFNGTVAVGGLTIGGSSVDTSSQVDTKISTAINAIPATDLSNYDTSTEVTNKINTLLGGAPAALDTLNELAAAIGDDANFASTITGQLSTINTQLSGKADSSSLSSYLRSDVTDTALKIRVGGSHITNQHGSSAPFQVNGFSRMGAIAMHQSSAPTAGTGAPEADHKWLTNIGGVLRWGTQSDTNDSTIWHTGNDGSGSGLDADKLDGQEGSFYRDASNINAGTFPDRFSNTSRYNIGLINGNGSNSYDKLRVWDSSSYAIGMHSGQTFGWLNDYAMTFTMNNESDRGFLWRDTSDSSAQGAMSLTTNGNLCVGNAIAVGGQTTRYLTEPSGQYGSIQVSGGGYGGWEGLSIDGRAVFMHNGDAATGIYNDVNNHWLFYAIHNGSSYMYHAGNECIKTVSSTDATIGGDYIVRTAGAGLSKSGSTINIDFSSLSSI